ncbi:hypothetical protein [Thioalkalivibrio thiocyanodenitrificans]|uniref:hypothetical protein n=1 Tax=Thioalkalivibrio thiocyanodenitrificans TaxID=243063 RepID=UPI00036A7609|nr:hypothetical protein [Thioalkalivibrio thiocyanodenitrificans]
MDKTGVYSKTPKGHQEIRERSLKLPPKLRQLLIMIDGESNVATLMERLEAMGDIRGHLSALEHLDLIEASGGAANPPSSVSAEPTDDALQETRRNLSHLLLDSLGPNAESLAMKIEGARSREELLGHCEASFAIVRDMLGKTRADTYWARVRDILG